MRTSFEAPAKGAGQEESRRDESWFSLATIMLLCAVAAGAWFATIQAYGPIFLAPANGP